MSDKIKKLVNTLITLSNSSDVDVVMTTFIINEGTGTICHLGSPILNELKVLYFT